MDNSIVEYTNTGIRHTLLCASRVCVRLELPETANRTFPVNTRRSR